MAGSGTWGRVSAQSTGATRPCKLAYEDVKHIAILHSMAIHMAILCCDGNPVLRVLCPANAPFQLLKRMCADGRV